MASTEVRLDLPLPNTEEEEEAKIVLPLIKPTNPIYKFLNGLGKDAGTGYERKFAPSRDYVDLEVSSDGEEQDDEEDDEESERKTTRKTRRKSKSRKEDYRRPNLKFDAFFEEEKSTYSVPQLHEYYETLYRFTKMGCYNILMLVLGLPLIVFWGLFLSTLSFVINWMYQPLLKVLIWIMNATLPCLKPLQKCCGGFAKVIAQACNCARTLGAGGIGGHH